MFNLLSIMLSGLLVGLAARFLYPGAIEMGLLKTILLGIGGSLLAGLVASRGQTDGPFNRAGCLASIVGAMVIIFIARHLN